MKATVVGIVVSSMLLGAELVLMIQVNAASATTVAHSPESADPELDEPVFFLEPEVITPASFLGGEPLVVRNGDELFLLGELRTTGEM